MHNPEPTKRERYKAYLLSEHWQGLRERTFALAQGRCENCLSTEALQGHHLIYRTPLEDCTTDDIMALCHSCHERWHERHSSHVIATRQSVIRFLQEPTALPVQKDRKKKAAKEAKKIKALSVHKKPMRLFHRAVTVFQQSDRTQNALAEFIGSLASVWKYLPSRPGPAPNIIETPKTPLIEPDPEPKRKESVPKKMKGQPHWFCPTRQPFQEQLVEDAEFRDAVTKMNRAQFSIYCKGRRFDNIQWANAFAVYDRWGKMNGRTVADSREWKPD